MRFRGIVAVALVGLLAGCGQTRMVNTASPESLAESRVNRVANNRLAHLELVDGQKLYVVDVEVGTEMSSWMHPTSGEITEVPTSQIESITVVRAGQGALVGFGVGVVLGGAFGLVRAFIQGDDPADDPWGVSREKKLAVYPPAHAVYTSIGTTAIGAIVGRKIEFRIMSGSEEISPAHLAGDRATP